MGLCGGRGMDCHRKKDYTGQGHFVYCKGVRKNTHYTYAYAVVDSAKGVESSTHEALNKIPIQCLANQTDAYFEGFDCRRETCPGGGGSYMERN